MFFSFIVPERHASELVIGGMNHVDKRVDAKFFAS
jgi:hypothetical protein